MSGRPKKRREQDYITIKFHNSPICKRLGELINENNQKDFCEKLGITERTVYHWRKGQARPDIDKLGDIASYFGVTTDYLTGRISNPAPTLEIAYICEYIGLSAQAVQYLAFLNTPFDRIGKTELITKDYPGVKNIADIPEGDREIVLEIAQDVNNKEALKILNDILVTSTGNEHETYGLQILVHIYRYCRNEFEDYTPARNTRITGLISTVTVEQQRNLELLFLNDIIARLHAKLLEERKKVEHNETDE